jgi:hypothetical protein
LAGHHENAIFDHALGHDGRLWTNFNPVRADIGANLIAGLHPKYPQGVVR